MCPIHNSNILKIKRIIARVLPRLKPNEKDVSSAYHIFERVKSFVADCSKTLSIPSKLVLTGSLAKGTFIKGSHDIDVFLLIKKDVIIDRNFVNAYADCLINKLDHIQIDYAQHPYLSAELDGWILDIVPAYDIKHTKFRKSAVDRTIFHTKYVLTHMTEKQKDEVRILKQFLKANNLYGAEIKVEGFPGYLCELMIIRYGSFIDFLKSVLKWKKGEIIDIEKYYSPKDYEKLREKFRTPLIVIDPTDKYRNVASALSDGNFKLLKRIVKSFLEHPSSKYFKIVKKTKTSILNELKTKYKSKPILYISFDALYENEESNWGKIKRISRILSKKLEELSIHVFDYGLYVDSKYHLFFVLSKTKLPLYIKFKGPARKRLKLNIWKRACELFKEMHEKLGDKTVVGDEECYAFRKRSEKERNILINSKHILEELFKDSNLSLRHLTLKFK